MLSACGNIFILKIWKLDVPKKNHDDEDGRAPTCLEAQSQSLMLDVPNYEQL